MSEHLLKEGDKDAASVLLGAVLGGFASETGRRLWRAWGQLLRESKATFEIASWAGSLPCFVSLSVTLCALCALVVNHGNNKMFQVVTNLEDLMKVFIVRGIVFVEEQGVPYEIEHDAYDLSATHILGEMDGEPFAAGRIRAVGEYAKLERVSSIRKQYRGKGLGHKLTEFMIAVAKEQGFKKFKVHAQAYLADFYQKHGFEIVGDMFKEAGIDHYLMVRDDS